MIGKNNTLGSVIEKLVEGLLSRQLKCGLAKVIQYYENGYADIQFIVKTSDLNNEGEPDVIYSVPVCMPYYGDFSIKNSVDVGTICLYLILDHAISLDWFNSTTKEYIDYDNRFAPHDRNFMVVIPLMQNETTNEDLEIIGDNNIIKLQKDGTIILKNEKTEVKIDVNGDVNLNNGSVDIKIYNDGKINIETIANDSRFFMNDTAITMQTDSNDNLNGYSINNSKINIGTFKSGHDPFIPVARVGDQCTIDWNIAIPKIISALTPVFVLAGGGPVIPVPSIDPSVIKIYTGSEIVSSN